MRNLHIVFHCGYTNLHSHQQCMRVPFSTHCNQHLFVIVLIKSVRCEVRISLKTVFGLCAKLLHSDAPSVLMSLFESFLCICFDTYNNAKLTSFSSWFKTTTLLLNLSPSSSFLLEQNCSAPCFAPKAKLLSSPLSQSGTGLFSTQDLMPHFCPS